MCHKYCGHGDKRVNKQVLPPTSFPLYFPPIRLQRAAFQPGWVINLSPERLASVSAPVVLLPSVLHPRNPAHNIFFTSFPFLRGSVSILRGARIKCHLTGEKEEKLSVHLTSPDRNAIDINPMAKHPRARTRLCANIEISSSKRLFVC